MRDDASRCGDCGQVVLDSGLFNCSFKVEAWRLSPSRFSLKLQPQASASPQVSP